MKNKTKPDENEIKIIVVDQFSATFYNLLGCHGEGRSGAIVVVGL